MSFFQPFKIWSFFTIFCRSLLNMPRNITIKNQKIHSLEKLYVQKTAQIAKIANFWPFKDKFWPFFHDFLKIASKYAQKHHIKKQIKLIHWTNFRVRKTGKMAKKGPFFGPGGPNFDPFFTILCKSLPSMPLLPKSTTWPISCSRPAPNKLDNNARHC